MTVTTSTSTLPRVDIVLPVYNGASHLRETLATIEHQTYEQIHVYIIDDHSDDATPSILGNHQSKFPLQIIRHPENRGLSAARNSGIASGTGDYIAILDADDLWKPSKIEKQVAMFQASEASLGIVSSDFQIIDEYGVMADASVYDYCRDLTPLSRQILVLGNVVSGGSAALIKRECFDRLGGFDESLSACEDWEMWHRIAAAYSIRIVREPLVLVRRHSQSMQGDTPRMLKNRIEVFRRFAEDKDSHDLAEACLRQECLSAFRYLPQDMRQSYDACMNELRSLGIDSGTVPTSIWRSAYRRHCLTRAIYSQWRKINNHYRIRERVQQQPGLKRLYKALRWRAVAVYRKLKA